MNQQNGERFKEYLRSRGIEAALLTSPWTITWLTGYAPPIQTGPSPFEGGPALGWWRGGELILLVSDAEAGPASETGVEVREYAGYTVEEPLAVVARQAALLREVLGDQHGGRATVGIEMQFLPASLLATVQESLAGASLQALDGMLEPLRVVKTEEEVARLRAALALCDLAQAEVQAAMRPGISEIALWGMVKSRLEVEAGGRLPVLADLVAGMRTGDVGGLPGPALLQEGDPLIADIVPRLDGYWGDNCGTHFVGSPGAVSGEMRRAYDTVRAALQRGIDAVRPGVVACDLDALLRDAVRDAGYAPYPHHSGHGLGVTFHEEPRIVPYNDLRLAPGMVVALEPGVYLPGVGGVRLEDVVLVTDDGCELLTRHLASTA